MDLKFFGGASEDGVSGSLLKYDIEYLRTRGLFNRGELTLIRRLHFRNVHVYLSTSSHIANFLKV